ncbi:MAG: hypothetical protein H0U53_00365 [Actinobacteria bacterium]|nr:hypothetical protein [Actinomycetota bacterium]
MGGYKTARWRVSLGDSHWDELAGKVALLSLPRSFGLSLIQGYFVEPLLEMAFVRRGAILAPAAGFVNGRGATLLLGASRSGKSSLMVRALGEGVRILGDDQVIISSQKTTFSFPRRLRVYPDIRTTAPSTYSTFPRGTRTALRGLGALSRSTAKWVAPPLRIQPSAVGPAPAKEELPLERIYLIQRDERVEEPHRSVVDVLTIVERMLALLDRQREKLSPIVAAEPAWIKLLEHVRDRERHILGKALEGIDAEQLIMPKRWEPVRAIDYLQQQIGVGV